MTSGTKCVSCNNWFYLKRFDVNLLINKKEVKCSKFKQMFRIYFHFAFQFSFCIASNALYTIKLEQFFHISILTFNNQGALIPFSASKRKRSFLNWKNRGNCRRKLLHEKVKFLIGYSETFIYFYIIILCGANYSKMDQIMDDFKFFKGFLPQILLGPFLNTLSHIFLSFQF